VRSKSGGAALPVHERVGLFLDSCTCGVINVCGPRGSGKSTALAHLAMVLGGHPRLRLHDGGVFERIESAARDYVVVYASREPVSDALAWYEMAPWGDDDCVEYLAASNRPRCRSVMSRVTASEGRDALGGSPALWTVVLDELAADDSLVDITEALRHHLARRLADPVSRNLAMSFSLMVLCQEQDPKTGWPQAADVALAQHMPKLLGGDPHPLLWHRPVRLLLASQRIIWELCGDVSRGFSRDDCEALSHKLPPDLIRETASLARCRPAALRRLLAEIKGPCPEHHAMAASLLHAANVGWRPPPSSVATGPHGGKDGKFWLRLSGALLAGARWPGVDLTGALLKGADLSAADLRSAKLDWARASRSNLRDASLRGASLRCMRAVGADLTGADMTAADAEGADFEEALLAKAELSSAVLAGVNLKQADLTGATLRGANLSDAKLEETKLTDAVLADANFSGAVLRDVRLTEAVTLLGASFRGATLDDCDLENVCLPDTDFRGASLAGACLTGATMPGCDLRGANLRETGLADVNWEGANLRDADLAGATFHMGTTRCGLVAGPDAYSPPSEGSKTGFYTDEYNEQDYKPPEEIRRANLCRADLRGAKVKGVDFYLVDLRGATYSEKQEKHFRRCGAILDERR
jgi:uncharacterized protein YjbI with pentapeptide repeats